MTLNRRPFAAEFGIQHEAAAVDRGQIAVLGVVRDVFLEEDHAMPIAYELPDKTAPERRMTIPPRGTDRQTEDHEFHRGHAVQLTFPCRLNRILKSVVAVWAYV